MSGLGIGCVEGLPVVGHAKISQQKCTCKGPGVGTGKRPAWLQCAEQGKGAGATEMRLSGFVGFSSERESSDSTGVFQKG